MRKDHHPPPVNWMSKFTQALRMRIPSSNVQAERAGSLSGVVCTNVASDADTLLSLFPQRTPSAWFYRCCWVVSAKTLKKCNFVSDSA